MPFDVILHCDGIVKCCAMGPKKANLRSDMGTIVKDFGLLDSLPYKPLTRANILGRYNGIRGVLSFTNTPCWTSDVLPEWKTIAKIVSEIMELYGKFGVKCNHERHIHKKIKKIKTDYFKSKKNAQAAKIYMYANVGHLKGK